MTIKSLLVKIGADVAEFEAKLTQSEKKFKAVGDRMTSIGKTMTAAVTLPLVGIGIAAFKMSNDFNAAMANVATLIPGNTERVDELKRGVQDLAVATGKSTGDMALGLYQVISALGDSADSMKILEISARAGAAGMATTEDAINLVSAVTKGYGDTSVEAAQKAADLAFQTVKLGQTSFPELAASIGRVVPIAATLGVAQEELFTGFATLTGVTGGAAEVSTQFKAVLQSTLQPTEGMKAALDKLGYSSGAAMIESEGLVGGLRKLIGTTDGSQTSTAKLFGSVEALTAVFALTGGQADTFDSKLLDLKNSTGALDEAFKEQTEGVNKIGFTWDQFKVKLEVTAQRLGDTLAPAFEKAVDFINAGVDAVQSVIQWFNRLPGPVQAVVGVMIGLAAGAGPVLIVAGKIVTMIPTLVAGFGAIKAAVLAMLGPMGLVVAGATAAGLALNSLINKYIEKQDAEMAAIVETGNKVGGAFQMRKRLIEADIVTHEEWRDMFNKAGRDQLKMLEMISTDPAYAHIQKAWDDIKGKQKEALKSTGDSFEDAAIRMETAAQISQTQLDAIANHHRTLTDEINKAVMSEYEYAKWAAEQKYLARTAAIEKEIESESAKREALELAAQAHQLELQGIDKAHHEVTLTKAEAHMGKRAEKWKQHQAALIAQDEAYNAAKDQITQNLNKLRMSELEYSQWAMDEEEAARAAHIEKTITDEGRKEELLTALREEYEKKRFALSEDYNKKTTDRLKDTMQDLRSAISSFIGDVMTLYVAQKEGRLDQIDEEYKRQREAIENSLLNEKEKAGALAALDEKTASEREKIEKQIGRAKQASAIKQALINIAQGVTAALSSAPPPFNIVLAGITAAAGAVHLATIKAQKFGDGGIVTRPTFAMIGEKGPEAVIPLDKAGALAGLGGGVNVKAYFYGDIHNAGDLDEISRRLAQRVTRAVQGGRV